jgi:hypothetical protein
MKKSKTDLQKLTKLMDEFKIKYFIEENENDYIEVRIGSNHHNNIPIFYFTNDEEFIEVETGIEKI